MRRREKMMADRHEIDELIASAQVCRLGLCDGDEPYVVPLCFGYDGQRLYFHCAAAGRKLDIIARNKKVCFEFDAPGELTHGLVGCHCSMPYASVIGLGRAEILHDEAERIAGLDAIMRHYDGPAGPYEPAMLARTAVIAVHVESISGKRSS